MIERDLVMLASGILGGVGLTFAVDTYLAMRHAEPEPEDAAHFGRHVYGGGPSCVLGGCDAPNRRYKAEDPRETAVLGDYPALPERG